MRKLTAFIVTMLLVLQAVAASSNFTTPLAPTHSYKDSLLRPHLFQPAPIAPHTFSDRLKQKLVRKALRWQHKQHSEKQTTKDTLALISLICGVAGILLLLVPYLSALTLLLAPAAIIMGIIALSKNHNPKSRTKAIIGIVAGTVPIILFIVLLFVLIAFWGGGIE